MINPFVELARDPVGVLAWIGYALLMAAIVLVAVPWSARQLATLWVRYRKNAAGPEWWSFGSRRRGYIPPLSWLARLFAVILALTVTVWALGAFIWIIA